MTAPAAATTPALRGYLHLVAALAAPFALLYLLARADSASDYVGVSLFGSGLILLFGISASYHVPPWPARVRGLLRRIDHAVIFAFVAFAYAPFCIIVLPLAWGIPLLSTVGGLALGGAILKLAWPGLPRFLNLGTYVALGWAAVIAAPPLVQALSPAAVAMILGSGLLYTGGGLAHALRWPNPSPRVFGHHEVFHAATVAATALLYVVLATHVLE